MPTDSKVIQLAAPSQVNCRAVARCGASPGNYLETTLESSGSPATAVSRAQARPAVGNNQLVNGASLFLPAGTHRFTTRLANVMGGPVPEGVIDSLQVVPVSDPNLGNHIGQVNVMGAGDDYMMVRARNELNVTLRCELICTLAVAETVNSTLLITKMATHHITQSFPSTAVGPSAATLSIAALPYYLEANVLTKIHHVVSPMMPADAVVVLFASG